MLSRRKKDFTKKFKKLLTNGSEYDIIIERSAKNICGCSSMAESQPSKLVVWVRFPSPASLRLSEIFYVPLAQLDRATAF